MAADFGDCGVSLPRQQNGEVNPSPTDGRFQENDEKLGKIHRQSADGSKFLSITWFVTDCISPDKPFQPVSRVSHQKKERFHEIAFMF